MPSDDDPLEHADVGEAVTVSRDVELSTIDFEPDVFYGSDRTVEHDAVDARLVENDEGYHDVVVTFQGEMVKTLPYRWDQCREPRTPAEEREQQKQQRRKKWRRRVSMAIGTLIPMVVATFVTNDIMSRVAGRGPFEGVAAPGLGEIAGIVVGLVLFALFVLWAIRVMPRPGVGRRFA